MFTTRTRRTHTRAKMQSDGDARTHAHAGSQRHACTDTRTHTNEHSHTHSLHRQTHTQKAMHTHTFITRTSTRRQTRTQTGRKTCMRYVSAQQHRQIHLYILRCRESDTDKIRFECGACVHAGQRVGVCESLCACGDIRLSFPRERAAASVRARAYADPGAVQNTPHNRLGTQEYPHECPSSAR